MYTCQDMSAAPRFRWPSSVRVGLILIVITLCYLGLTVYTERPWSPSFIKPHRHGPLEIGEEYRGGATYEASSSNPLVTTSSYLGDSVQSITVDASTSAAKAVAKVTSTSIVQDDQSHAVEASNAPEIAIVVAKTADADTSWISEFFPSWSAYIYSVDDPTAELTVPNRGREGSAYLTYIIDHYRDATGSSSSLAKYVVFHHPDRKSWHNDDQTSDAVPVLQRVQFESVDEDGFINLRCDPDPGCEDKEPRRPTTVWDKDAGGIQWLTLFGRALEELKPYEHGPTPDWPQSVQSPCCAQFIVSREQILKVPKAKYEQFRAFLYDWHFKKYIPELEGDLILGENITTEGSEGAIAGGLFEYMWHMIFGRPAVNCMPIGECDCRNFGICDMSCEAEDGC